MSDQTQPITVAELIAHLQTFDPALPCCFSQYSEWSALTKEDIDVRELGVHRGDGYIGDARPDQPTQRWLTFPGN